MGETAHILRVVVVSPRDVQAERDCLPAVIEEINRDIARDQGLRLEFVGWEKDTYPGMHPAGPQSLIDPNLRVEDCDVGAVGRPYQAIRLWQVDPQSSVLSRVSDGKSVAGKRAWSI